ncbi:hypothetical protein GCM10022291_33730 [Postechiella marina]|uniref:Uncharacterized protein n=1 Tax=Postechiella marina TaxID=943941 RepID=A0ABP8CHP6_9FLAO
MYYSVEGHQVNKMVYNAKVKTNFYHGVRYTTDTLVVEKIVPNYYYDKLNVVTKSQLCKLFFSRYNIDTTKTLSIRYVDTLRSKDELPDKNLMVIKDSLGHVLESHSSSTNVFHLKSIKSKGYRCFTPSYKTYVKSYKSWYKKHKKFKKVVPLVFYGYNSGVSSEIEDVNFYKDYGKLIKKLFKYEDRNFAHLIIKPSGEFYIRYGFDEISFKSLFDDDAWTMNRNAFLKEKLKY